MKDSNRKNHLIEVIKEHILKKSNIKIKDLAQKDFEYLSFLIEEATGVSLSTSTLKRIWKNHYDRLPHESTLDTLAQYAGFSGWKNFKRTISDQQEPSVYKKQYSLSRKNIRKILAFAIIAVGIVAFSVMSLKPSKVFKDYKADFSADKTRTSGLPNTVVFSYDASHIPADSFFIQQSWDANRRVKADQNKHHITDIYYYPGYHEAKFIANETILETIDIVITTDKWLPLVTLNRGMDIPVYILPDSSFKLKDIAMIDGDVLRKHNIDTSGEFYLCHYNVGGFTPFDSESYTFKSKVRLTNCFQNPCPAIYIALLCEKNMSLISLTKRGCESNINLMVNNTFYNGKQEDLSAFGIEPEKWNEVILNVSGREFEVILNQKSVFTGKTNGSIGNIVGFNYTFKGLGEIDYVQLFDNQNNMAFEDRL